jgi:hypothetical protein
MWNEWFADLEVERVFNWSPKEWTGNVPTYNFVEQTGNKSIKKLPYLLAMEKASEGNLDRTVIVTEGVLDLDKGIESNMYAVKLSDMVKLGKNEG